MAPPRGIKAVEIRLDAVHEFGDTLLGNPYLWTVFFKADGSTLSVTDAGVVAGNCVVFPSSGSHGDLGAPPSFGTETVPYYYVGDSGGASNEITHLTWTVPNELGLFDTTIHPIPVAPSLHSILGVDQPGEFGVVAVLLNDAGLPEHAIEAGHATLNAEVESAINGLLRQLGQGHEAITDDDIQNATVDIPGKVQDAIRADLSLVETVGAIGGRDSEILQAVWRWNQDAAPNETLVQSTGENVFGDWAHWAYYGIRMDDFAVTGTMDLRDACPANAISSVFNWFVGSSSKPDTSEPTWHDSMRDFRDSGELRAHPALMVWWEVAARRGPHLAGLTVRDRQFREALQCLLIELPRLLADRQTVITADFAKHADKVLRGIARSPHADLRRVGLQGLELLRRAPNARVSDALTLLGHIQAPNDRTQRSGADARLHR